MLPASSALNTLIKLYIFDVMSGGLFFFFLICNGNVKSLYQIIKIIPTDLYFKILMNSTEKRSSLYPSFVKWDKFVPTVHYKQT